MILLLAAISLDSAAAEGSVLVEMVQSGEPATGFQIRDDGRWLELDGAWSVRFTLDAGAMDKARSAVAAIEDVTVPGGVVSDATGTTTWRLGGGATERVIVVPEGVSVPTLSTLYQTLQGLHRSVATSTWVVGGVPHEVNCNAAAVPELAALMRLFGSGPANSEGGVDGETVLEVTWRVDGNTAGRSVVLADGRVGATVGGELVLRRVLTGDTVSALQAGLAGVNWAVVCGPW